MDKRRVILFSCGALLLAALLWLIGATGKAVHDPALEPASTSGGAAPPGAPVIEEVHLQVQEDMGRERLLYEDYLKEMILPQYGVAVLSPFNLRGEWHGGTASLVSFLPDQQKGLVSYGIEDYNQDGQPELLTVLSHTFRKARTEVSADGAEYLVRSDGIEVKLFRIGEDGVEEMEAGPAGIGYRDVFSYSATGAFRAYYIPVEGTPLILLAQLWQYQQDGYPQVLMLDLYEIGKEEVRHVESLCDAGGKVTDLLKSGKAVYDCTGPVEDRKGFEGLYPFIRSRLEAHGVDGNFIRSFYDARTWAEETGTWEARGDIPVKDYLEAAVMDGQLLASATVEDIGHNPYVKKAQISDGLGSRKGLIPLMEEYLEDPRDLEDLRKVPTTAEVPVETMPETTEESTVQTEEEPAAGQPYPWPDESQGLAPSGEAAQGSDAPPQTQTDQGTDGPGEGTSEPTEGSTAPSGGSGETGGEGAGPGASL